MNGSIGDTRILIMATVRACGVALLLGLPRTLLAQNYSLPPVNMVTAAQGSQVVVIPASGEIEFGGSLLKRVAIGKSSAVVTYMNRSIQALKPKYRFRVFDAYGIEIGQFDCKWLIQMINPGETETENKSFSVADLASPMQFTEVVFPRDWLTPVYLMVEGGESK